MQNKTLKSLIFFLFSSLLSAALFFTASAETADRKIFTFTSDDDIINFAAGKNAVALSIEDSFLRIDFTGDENPLFYTVLDEGSGFGIKDYPIIKIKYYTNSLDDVMILYYGFKEKATKDNPLDIDAKQAYSADIKRGEWSEVTVDLSKIRTNYTLMTLRIDPVGCVFYNNDVFCIEYIGFFKTVEDADAYKTEDRQIPLIAERVDGETIAFAPFDLSEVDYSKIDAETKTVTVAAATDGAKFEIAAPDEVPAPAGDRENGAAIYKIIIISAIAAVCVAAAVFAAHKSRGGRKKI